MTRVVGSLSEGARLAPGRELSAGVAVAGIDEIRDPQPARPVRRRAIQRLGKIASVRGGVAETDLLLDVGQFERTPFHGEQRDAALVGDESASLLSRFARR